MNTILNHEQQKIAEWLSKVKFRKQLVGGVSEQDVWQKIEELNKMYEAALSAERARYDALLAGQRGTVSFESDTPEAVQKGKETCDG